MNHQVNENLIYPLFKHLESKQYGQIHYNYLILSNPMCCYQKRLEAASNLWNSLSNCPVPHSIEPRFWQYITWWYRRYLSKQPEPAARDYPQHPDDSSVFSKEPAFEMETIEKKQKIDELYECLDKLGIGKFEDNY